ncbi:ABC transporter substrate-binding protein [soil metagenome]
MLISPRALVRLLLATGIVLASFAMAQSTLTIGRATDITNMNPFRQANNATSEVTYTVHEGLVTFTPDLELVPQLATSWELLDDGVTWRFFLREGVNFHSGNPFNAEVVKWNFETMMNPDDPGVAAGLLAAFREVEVVDEYTIDVTLHDPNVVFVATLGAPLLMMVDMLHYEEVGETAYSQQSPSGTGPFRFVSWSPGQRVVLEANEGYWGDVGPEVDRVVFEVIPEESSRVLALRTGEVDMIFGVPAEQMDALDAMSGLQVWRTPTLRTVFLEMVTQHPFLTRDVRHAIAHAVDRDQISAIIGDNGSPAYSHGPPGTLGFFDHTFPYDVERAAELLEGEGWTLGNDGFRTKDGQRLSVSNLARGVTPGEIEALQVLQLQLRAVGVEMTIERVDAAAWTGTMNDGAVAWAENRTVPSHSMWTSAAGIRTGEVGYLMNRPKCEQTIRNWTMIECTPEYDEAFARSQMPLDLDERQTAYEVLGQYTMEWQARVPLFHVQSNIAAKDSVEGFVVNPQDALDLRGVSLGN